MAYTVEQVIRPALQELLVQGSETPLEADEYRDTIFALNTWMADLEARGVDLGYTTVDSLSDVVTVPDGAIMGIVSNLALLIAPQFGAMPSNELYRKAKRGMNTIYKLGQVIIDSEYPHTLPRGSGNNPSPVLGDNFYHWNDGSVGDADANS